MAGHPLQGGVGDDDVGARPAMAGSQCATSDSTHSTRSSVSSARAASSICRRVVDAHDAGFRPPLGEGQRARAVAAAEVDDERGSSAPTRASRSPNGRTGGRRTWRTAGGPTLCSSLLLLPSSDRAVARPNSPACILISRYLTGVQLPSCPRTTSTASSRPGGASAPTSTSRRCRSSRGSRGWRAGSTSTASRPSPEHQLEGWEFDVLSALRRAGAPYQLSPGQLIRQTLVTSGTMTNRVDRLERRGLVGRSPDPPDRRGVIVRLTPDRPADRRRRHGRPARPRARPARGAAGDSATTSPPAAAAALPSRPPRHVIARPSSAGAQRRDVAVSGGRQGSTISAAASHSSSSTSRSSTISRSCR